jgi:hypothetical protein
MYVNMCKQNLLKNCSVEETILDFFDREPMKSEECAFEEGI